MRLLDLFCGAGGAAMGYHRAGFEVVGVDIEPMPHFPFEFHQADALDYCREHGHEFDVIHASPPCQRYSTMTNGRWKDRVETHPDLIAPTRELLIASGKPYIIENVSGARAELINPVLLCGTMFGLQTKHGNQLLRHRWFESSFWPGLVPPCRHGKESAIGVYGGGQNPARRKRRYKAECEDLDFGISERRRAMGIDWMTGLELNEAIPPAYTEWLGRRLMEAIR